VSYHFQKQPGLVNGDKAAKFRETKLYPPSKQRSRFTSGSPDQLEFFEDLRGSF